MKESLREQILKIEQEHKKRKQIDPWRQRYHVMPPVGRLSNPNGLCECDGEYYIYFQYHPFDLHGEGNCWGLYKSRNLVHFSYIGVPLAPDHPLDKEGVHSGCVYVEGKEMYLYYTGSSARIESLNEAPSAFGSSTIVVKVSKDSYFNDVYSDKWALKLSIKNPSNQILQLSDPTVWKGEKCYYMLQIAKTEEQQETILLLSSKDKLTWEYVNEIKVKEVVGNTLEHPDFFTLASLKILCLSLRPSKKEEGCSYDSLYRAGYFILQGEVTGEHVLSEFHNLDSGFDFYSPQTFEDRKNRRILIALMGDIACDRAKEAVEDGWKNCLTVPRELSIKNGHIYQTPIKELELLRKEKQVTKIRGNYKCILNKSSEVLLYLGEQTACEECHITINKGLILSYTASKKKFSMEFIKDIGYGRGYREVTLNELSKVHLLLDTSSLEVFLNDGEEVFTSRLYSEEKEYELSIRCVAGEMNWWRLD